jgi:hypothetical protein
MSGLGEERAADRRTIRAASLLSTAPDTGERREQRDRVADPNRDLQRSDERE